MDSMNINTMATLGDNTFEPADANDDLRADGREQATVSASDEELRNQRWQAFDRLLQVSFGAIPPAYLFNSLSLDL
jgi:hypothetical protein